MNAEKLIYALLLLAEQMANYASVVAAANALPAPKALPEDFEDILAEAKKVAE